VSTFQTSRRALGTIDRDDELRGGTVEDSGFGVNLDYAAIWKGEYHEGQTKSLLMLLTLYLHTIKLSCLSIFCMPVEFLFTLVRCLEVTGKLGFSL
jgi:hypothetical protein